MASADKNPQQQTTLDQLHSTTGSTPEQATGLPSAAVPQAGERYRVIRPHARGGLGEVFVAEDQELAREVALKQIRAEHAHDAESRARFLLEAEITGGLEHPGIVPVYGLGQYPDGRPFYAMRFIKGDNLKSAIGRFHRIQNSESEVRNEKGSTIPNSEYSTIEFIGLEFRQLLGCF